MLRENKIVFQALPMIQPMGEFFVGVMDYQDLIDISYADIRALRRDLDEFMGIQRVLSDSRVQEISKFVGTVDATFPTSVVLSLPGDCFSYDSQSGEVELSEAEGIPFGKMAKILDGQHRIEGLKGCGREVFQLPVTVLVESDVADQAYIFATVNLAQTKVNRSLVYDLLDYSKSRSPQKTCHEIAVGLDSYEKSPFFEQIKRLGRATPGRSGETLSQAVIVNALLPLISTDAVTDRDRLKRGKSLRRARGKELSKAPLRNHFVDERDGDIAQILLSFFNAVKHKWPVAWASREKGQMLPRTNGFRAFMKFFKDVYLHLVTDLESPPKLSEPDFSKILERIELVDRDFNTERYPPGSAGETALYKDLKDQARV